MNREKFSHFFALADPVLVNAARLRRRVFLTWLLLAPVFAFVRPRSARSSDTNALDVDPFEALSSYVDTLIPEHLGPSATALGVDVQIRERVDRDPQFATLVAAGCQWLNAEAGRRSRAPRFSRLPETDRVAIVQRAEQASPKSGEWVFYQATRALVFELYYSDQRSWSGVGFARAPQPAGHMDYAMRPTKRAQ